ncbi:MAG TPA: GNAT family N-acetyltransferase [Polyangiaceae bacterium]|jgi:GNAT superfamily N-acetyltransferase|nr:GNAT family N-acetyltransferase [Polyangiaceae bacterium]
MRIDGPATGVAAECEAVLRTLPGWFGIESSLLQYVRDTEVLPTFVAREGQSLLGFLTLREHFAEAWEVHCIAVRAPERGRGLGAALHAHVERWLALRGARVLQVKTMAASCPSPEYAETRGFYSRIGYVALEVFPELWGPRLPVLQLIKMLPAAV